MYFFLRLDHILQVCQVCIREIFQGMFIYFFQEGGGSIFLFFFYLNCMLRDPLFRLFLGLSDITLLYTVPLDTNISMLVV